MEFLGLLLTESEHKVFLECLPMAQRPPVSAAALHDLLAREGYGECLVDDEALATAVQDINTRTDRFVLVLAHRLPSVIEIQIAPDDMAATLNLSTAHGLAAATSQEISLALGAAGVIFGIDEAAIAHACQLGSCSALQVAAGLAPVHGCDAIFSDLTPHTADRAPKLDDNGLIDYREHSAIAVVHRGDPLMRRTAATAGVDGRTVRGAVLAARAGRDDPFAAQLEGANTAKGDPDLLEASVSGQPVRVKFGVMVEPVLRLANVNLASGNIRFDGTVHVEGEISPGMKVWASGDIVVDGMVEGGQLESGADIRVCGGVIAHASLRAAGSVSARFAQAARIEAGTVIALGDMALECALISLNQIIIGADSGLRGRLAGGSASAMMLIRVPVLGSKKGSITSLVLGANAALDEQIAALEQRIAKEKLVEENLEKLVKQLKAAGDPKGMLARVQASRQHAMRVWGQSLAERKGLDEQAALAQTARVEVGVAVEGAVDLSIGKHAARIRRELDAGSFGLDAEGHVVFTDAQGKAAPLV